MDNGNGKVKRTIRFVLGVPFLAIMFIGVVFMDLVLMPFALIFALGDFVVHGKVQIFPKALVFGFFKFSFWNGVLVPLLNDLLSLKLRSFDNAF